MRSKHAESVMSNLARLLKEKRLAKGISHQRLADTAGISRSSISRIESGKHIPTISIAIKITEAMDESLADLIRKAGGK